MMDAKREQLIRRTWEHGRAEARFDRGPVWNMAIYRPIIPPEWNDDPIRPIPNSEYALAFRLEKSEHHYRITCEGIEVEAGMLPERKKPGAP